MINDILVHVCYLKKALSFIQAFKLKVVCPEKSLDAPTKYEWKLLTFRSLNISKQHIEVTYKNVFEVLDTFLNESLKYSFV